jgi:hypothetical protein
MKEIFSSSDVYEPPAGDLNSSVFSDNRGSIHRLVEGGRSYNLLYTKRGYLRSGDLHTVNQNDLILTGKVELWLRQNDQDIKRIYGPTSLIVIPPAIPHLFRFLEDTVMAEWWDGPFRAWYYRPYRKIIEGKKGLA